MSQRRGQSRSTPQRLDEFSLIDAFLAPFPRARVRLGPGDDCALLAPTRHALCVTTDAVVEDVHFTRAHFRLEDIGHKALAVNLSDLAAMGARPAWFLCALALPPGFGRADAVALARGMAALARESRIALVGGNVTRARELSVTLTVAGHAPARPLTRSGGRPGDLLYVSGTLGEARLGLQQLQAGVRGGAAVQRQRRPIPRLALGRLASRYASAGLDLSDGLAQDLGHLCAGSGVGARLELARLPVRPAVARALGAAAGGRPRDVLHAGLTAALAGGEDYELLLALPPGRARAFERACGREGHSVTCVGELTRGRERVILDPLGRRVPPPAGHDHLAGGPGRHIDPAGRQG